MAAPCPPNFGPMGEQLSLGKYNTVGVRRPQKPHPRTSPTGGALLSFEDHSASCSTEYSHQGLPQLPSEAALLQRASPSLPGINIYNSLAEVVAWSKREGRSLQHGVPSQQLSIKPLLCVSTVKWPGRYYS